MKTEGDLKQLAKRVYNKEVFLAANPEIIKLSFGMLVALAEKGTFPEDTVALYADYSEAGPRSINGYPMFFSCGVLTKPEYELFLSYYIEFEELMKKWEK